MVSQNYRYHAAAVTAARASGDVSALEKTKAPTPKSMSDGPEACSVLAKRRGNTAAKSTARMAAQVLNMVSHQMESVLFPKEKEVK